MIALVLQMLRTRRGQAVTLALLTMLAVGATVAVPAYLRAVDLEVVRAEVAAATAAERTVTLRDIVGEPGSGTASAFDDLTGALLDLPGFTEVYAAEFDAKGIEPESRASRVVYRQDVCAHLTMTAGRCLVGSGEVILGQAVADRLRLGPGSEVVLNPTGPRDPLTGDSGEPITDAAVVLPEILVVAGIYRVTDPAAEYWGGHDYFAVDGRGEPAMINSATLARLRPPLMTVTVDATAGPAAFDELAALRERLDRLDERTEGITQGFTVTSGIPGLADRVERSRALARQTVPVGAVPLLLLAYLTLWVAVDYGTEGRRPELAVVALRGARWWHRWLLAFGETAAAIVAGALAGCVAGQVAVGSLAAWRFPEVGAPLLSAGGLQFAPLAAAGALAVALAAQRRHLTGRVVDLLRRIRAAGSGGWRAAAVVVVLAAAAVTQLFLTGGSLDGVGMLAPALSIVALAAGCARLLAPAARAAGRVALRRGRLDIALAALQLGRRPAAQRMLLLLVAGVAVLGYAVSATDVAAQDRDLGARVSTGAPRVVTVMPVSRPQLLHAVRAADPDGRFAMAVAGLPGDPGRLAVDASRFAAVVDWLPQYGALDPARIADLLHPPAHAPVVFAGRDVTIGVEVAGIDSGEQVRLKAVFASVTGLGTSTADFGPVRDGPYTISRREPVCTEGCRLAGLGLSSDKIGGGAVEASLTLRALPGTGADLGDPSRWRATGGTVTAAGSGLRFDIAGVLTDGAWLQPLDTPGQLPALTTTSAAGRFTGFDRRPVDVRAAARAPVLPRVGSAGTVVDLEYADRLSTDAGPVDAPEVWLSAAAPPDVLARLTAQGLVVTGDRDVAAVRARLDQQGPALSLWFHLFTGALAVILAAGGIGLVAAVDRGPRAADLRVLRAQGLGRAVARRAALWTYPVLVVAAGVLGLLVTLVVWRLTGWALPALGGDAGLPPLPQPHWPRPVVLPATWLLCVVFLVAVAARAGATRTRPS